MGIKTYKPTSPGRRGMTVLDYSGITKTKPEKALIVRKARTGGRNGHGRLTAAHRGGGARKMVRKIDFRRDKDGIPGRVAAIEYDPGRSAFIALLHYADGEKRYIIAPRGLGVGDKVQSGADVEPRPGNAMPLRNVPQGLVVHNVELHPGRGGQMGRSAGAQIQLVAKEGAYAHLVLPSGEMRRVHLDCRATIGQIGNLDHANVSIGKAGRNRHRGWRPYVRGMTMNPCDHPMGGGEGRSKGGNVPTSRTGVLSKGGYTRSARKPTTKLIIRRRPKSKHN